MKKEHIFVYILLTLLNYVICDKVLDMYSAITLNSVLIIITCILIIGDRLYRNKYNEDERILEISENMAKKGTFESYNCGLAVKDDDGYLLVGISDKDGMNQHKPDDVLINNIYIIGPNALLNKTIYVSVVGPSGEICDISVLSQSFKDALMHSGLKYICYYDIHHNLWKEDIFKFCKEYI